jgi:hypothetical protein
VALNGRQENNYTLRELVCDYVQANSNEIINAFSEQEETKNFMQAETKRLIETQRNSGELATEIVIYGTALLLGIAIEIFVLGYTQSIIYNDNESLKKIYLINSNSNHFQALIPKRKSKAVLILKFLKQRT